MGILYGAKPVNTGQRIPRRARFCGSCFVGSQTVCSISLSACFFLCPCISDLGKILVLLVASGGACSDLFCL